VAKLGACLWSPDTSRPSDLSVCVYAYATDAFLLWDFSAKAGTQVIVPFRDEDEKRHLKVMGDLGQIVPLVRLMSPRGPTRPIGVCSFSRVR
jgi:hypothetical protein